MIQPLGDQPKSLALGAKAAANVLAEAAALEERQAAKAP
jgi:hypothetical protein